MSWTNCLEKLMHILCSLPIEKTHNAAHKLLDDLLEKKTNLATSIADTNREINDENIAKEGTESLLDEEREYLWSIKPDCDWILKEFQPRRDQRGEEVQALIEAKGMLAGAAPPSASFLQRK
jgi:hypothetical protein